MYQKLIIVGNVGKDPEMQYTKEGVPFTKFSVAVQRYGRETPDWFTVTVWRKTAEVANEYVHKGMQVLVEGTVSVYAYIRQDGTAGASMEVNGDVVKFIGKKSDNAEENGSYVGTTDSAEDSIPF
jgi:single-strand DNA-binding protein